MSSKTKTNFLENDPVRFPEMPYDKNDVFYCLEQNFDRARLLVLH